MTYYKAHYASPLGPLSIVCSENELVQIAFSTTETTRISSAVQETIRWLDAYFSGQKPSPLELSLKPAGTAFQQQVWKYLLEIPYGQAVTYGQIADRIATARGIKRMSAQAVGQAVGANPIPIVIPCHRVLGTKGRLTGYSGGLTYKIQLLDHEQVAYKK